MRSEIQKPYYLKSRKMAAIFSNHLKPGHKCSDFKWSGFGMAGTIAVAVSKALPFEI